MRHELKVLQGAIGIVLAEAKGISGTAFPKQPDKMLQLYEFEACPYCRKVRQALTYLNLDYEIYPCPKKGTLFRPKAMQISGKMQFPLLIDPNTNTVIQDSSEIVEYLFVNYGKEGQLPPAKWQENKKREIKRSLISVVSMMRGFKADKVNKARIKRNAQPKKLLELYTFEMSPFSRLIKERLCELELAYINRNVAQERRQDMGMADFRNYKKYTPKRAGKRERIMHEVMNGRMQVPFLIDPNKGVELFESKEILTYLNKTYGKI